MRHSMRSRKSRPTWNRPEPTPKTARPTVPCGSWPTARIEADQARAPAVSIRPCSRKGRVGLVRGARGRRGDVGAGGSGRVLDRHGRDSCSMRWGAAVCGMPEDSPSRRPARQGERSRRRSPRVVPPTRDRGPLTAGHVRGDTARVSRTSPAAPARPRAAVASYVPLVVAARLPGRVGVARRDQHRRRADRSRHRLRLPGGPARAGARRVGRLGAARAAGRRASGVVLGAVAVVWSVDGALSGWLAHGYAHDSVGTDARLLVRGPLRRRAAVRAGGRAAALPDRAAAAAVAGGAIVRGACCWRPSRCRWCSCSRPTTSSTPTPVPGVSTEVVQPSGHRRSRGGHAARRAGAHPRVDRRRGRPAVGPPPAGDARRSARSCAGCCGPGSCACCSSSPVRRCRSAGASPRSSSTSR